MITRANRIILVILVVALALYIVTLNTATVTIYLPPGKQISGNTGVILIGAFVCGILAAAIVGLFFGIKAYFRERNLHHRDRQRQAFYQGMLKARGFLATEEWGKAKQQWEQIVRKDPTDIIARVELSKSLQGSGELREALRVLDAARTADPKNIEVLFRAAELNLALKNKTAAVDNLALILYHHPNKRAAELACALSEDLERLEDALEYHGRIKSLTGTEDESVVAQLEFKKILRDHAQDQQALREQLNAFLKRRPTFVPALKQLASLEVEAGRVEAAAESLVKVAKASGSIEFWRELCELWLRRGEPEKAVAAAKSAANETRAHNRVAAELNLIRTYLALNMLEEAKKSIDGFNALLQRENISFPPDLREYYYALKGICLNRLGEYKQSSEIWKILLDEDVDKRSYFHDQSTSVNGDAPAPRLSTP